MAWTVVVCRARIRRSRTDRRQPRRQPVDGDRRQRTCSRSGPSSRSVPQRLDRGGGDAAEARVQQVGASMGRRQLHGVTDTPQQLDAQQVFQRARNWWLIAEGVTASSRAASLIDRWRAAARRRVQGILRQWDAHGPPYLLARRRRHQIVPRCIRRRRRTAAPGPEPAGRCRYQASAAMISAPRPEPRFRAPPLAGRPATPRAGPSTVQCADQSRFSRWNAPASLRGTAGRPGPWRRCPAAPGSTAPSGPERCDEGYATAQSRHPNVLIFTTSSLDGF